MIILLWRHDAAESVGTANKSCARVGNGVCATGRPAAMAMRGLTVFIADLRNCRWGASQTVADNSSGCSRVFFSPLHPLCLLRSVSPPVCRSTKEQEEKRVDKEMAHIRSKFTSETHMNGYQRKKYVWKILYMYMLGYEVDFGHMEAVNLISSPKYLCRDILMS